MLIRTSFRIGRDARTGRFISIRTARINPRTTVIETIPIHRPVRVSAARKRRARK